MLQTTWVHTIALSIHWNEHFPEAKVLNKIVWNNYIRHIHICMPAIEE